MIVDNICRKYLNSYWLSDNLTDLIFGNVHSHLVSLTAPVYVNLATTKTLFIEHMMRTYWALIWAVPSHITRFLVSMIITKINGYWSIHITISLMPIVELLVGFQRCLLIGDLFKGHNLLPLSISYTLNLKSGELTKWFMFNITHISGFAKWAWEVNVTLLFISGVDWLLFWILPVALVIVYFGSSR